MGYYSDNDELVDSIDSEEEFNHREKRQWKRMNRGRGDKIWRWHIKTWRDDRFSNDHILKHEHRITQRFAERTDVTPSTPVVDILSEISLSQGSSSSTSSSQNTNAPSKFDDSSQIRKQAQVSSKWQIL